MSTEVQTELERIESNVAAAYTAAEEQGADMPEAQTTDNLAETVRSIKSVKFTEQTLSDDQQTQARTNIGAASQADLNQLSSEKLDKTRLTLGIHTDGLIYLFVDGAPTGTGIAVSSGGDVVGYVDEDNNIVISGELPDGTYTVKYELDDGSTVSIGQLVLDDNVYYAVMNTLTNCVNSNAASQVTGGSSYSATITASSGYTLDSVEVTMGGDAVTVTNGVIDIENVTGNIVITAIAVESVAGYTNLADPTSADWQRDTRLATSYGYGKENVGSEFTNYIPAKIGSVLSVKGLNLYGLVNNQNAAIAIYTSTDTSINSEGDVAGYQTFCFTSIKSANSSDGAREQVSVNGDIYTYTILLHGDGRQLANTETAYIRISAPLTDGYSPEDVIITVNEEIT